MYNVQKYYITWYCRVLVFGFAYGNNLMSFIKAAKFQ